MLTSSALCKRHPVIKSVAYSIDNNSLSFIVLSVFLFLSDTVHLISLTSRYAFKQNINRPVWTSEHYILKCLYIEPVCIDYFQGSSGKDLGSILYILCVILFSFGSEKILFPLCLHCRKKITNVLITVMECVIHHIKSGIEVNISNSDDNSREKFINKINLNWTVNDLFDYITFLL